MKPHFQIQSARLIAPVVFFVILFVGVTGQARAQDFLLGSYADHSTGYLLFARLAAMAIGGALGYGIGALFSPALKEFRRYIKVGLAAVVIIYALFGGVPIADAVSYLLATIIFFIALVVGKRLGRKIVARAATRKRPTSLGSAQWANLEHLQQNGIIGCDGFILGEFVTGGPREVARPLQYRGERHLLTVAPTRSGKGVSSIIPNLLMYPGSAFVIDPKGENALITATRRGVGSKPDNIPGMGQDVILLDPWDLAASKVNLKSASFNPIDWIKADDPDAGENAFLLADALVMSEAKDEGRFWDEEAKALLMGLILYVGIAREEEGQRTLGRVRDLLTLDDNGFKAILTKMFKHPHPIVQSTAARQASKDTKLFSSVLATAQSHTHFLDSERIRKSLSRSDFSFDDLKSKPTSIYLILPADRLRTFDRWLRLLIQQAITVNARNIELKPKRPILFLLDEMPTLGRLPALEQAYGLMAGFGMQLWGIVQDLSQLARVYGDNGWQTFISNSGVIQYFGSRDRMTADYFSALCGVTTVELHNISWVVGKAIGFVTGSGGSSSSESKSWSRSTGSSEAQRQLAYPDELMVLKGHQQIVFVENLDPIPSQKVIWYKNNVLKKLGVNLLGHSDEELSAATPEILEASEKQPSEATTSQWSDPHYRDRSWVVSYSPGRNKWPD
jgi:type IV secretion system protein VirD4